MLITKNYDSFISRDFIVFNLDFTYAWKINLIKIQVFLLFYYKY